MEYPNETLAFLLGVIGILSVATTAFRWKIVQIQKDTKRNMMTDENREDIERLDAMVLALCNRVARFEGAFSQHNKEAVK